ncbi:MAG TPA: type I-U CRISPR-associated protein Csx17 [Verrucomicrobiota bacterium]|nr:type I-U CRISPR-associated protein Csx17 [Verrucomicrobiota bacterium]HNU51365.1 type I-U CRISPR-associated protein Csx17 [Verrucomicrobiota bacterium]
MNLQPLPLPGCAPTPLAHYLKALGVLRLLSEQLPPDLPRPRGAWQGETFVLCSTLDRASLERFFLHEYRPTPILAPWNGGSGFYFQEGKTNQRDPLTGRKIKTGQRTVSTKATCALARIEDSKARRFSDLRDAIAVCRTVVRAMGFEAAPKEAEKAHLLLQLRSRLRESFVNAQDAAYVLLGNDVKPPPLLGTGFNDGNLDFTSNFLQRLAELFDLDTGQPHAAITPLLAGSLFAEPVRGLTDTAIGQFFPHAAGGSNSTSGFDAKAAVNPWDFVLMLEGALLFAAAAVKRLETTRPGDLAYPFSVRPSGFGYASGSKADSAARCELWVPLWENPASLSELRQVLGEGRARLPNRAARDGLEFTRAVSGLGVDRGLSAFQRYSFAQRNGLAFFATPLDRVPVRRNAQATALLDDLDRNDWLDRARSAGRDDRAPNAVASAVRQLEQSALALLRSNQQAADEQAAVESLLVAVADTEAALVRSLRWTQSNYLSPVPLLSSAWWQCLRHGKSVELDLAAGLASLRRPSLRIHWEPLDVEKPFSVWDANSREAVWQDSTLEETLLAIHRQRILLEADHPAALAATYSVRPASIAAFLDHQTDDFQLARLTRALSLVQLPPDADRDSSGGAAEICAEACAALPALFALPRLALAGRVAGSSEEMPRLAAILRRGAAGDGPAMTRLAVQRLRGSGFTPALREVPAHGASVRRAAAATLFPLSDGALAALAEGLRPLTISV